jgi:hypothetical protein
MWSVNNQPDSNKMNHHYLDKKKKAEIEGQKHLLVPQKGTPTDPS